MMLVKHCCQVTLTMLSLMHGAGVTCLVIGIILSLFVRGEKMSLRIWRKQLLASDLGLPVVATNDVCFLASEDYEAHEARVCIQSGYCLNDPKRPRAYSSSQYFKSQAQMVELFSDIPSALENTLQIARRCNVKLELGKVFAQFPCARRGGFG